MGVTVDIIIIISPHNPGLGKDTERKPILSDIFSGAGSSFTLCGQHTGYPSIEETQENSPYTGQPYSHGQCLPLLGLCPLLVSDLSAFLGTWSPSTGLGSNPGKGL